MSEGNRTIICDPWAGRANRIEGDRVCLLPIDVREANAAFIVRACNNHEALVKALTGLIDQADAQFRAGDRYATFNKQTITQARAALTAI